MHYWGDHWFKKHGEEFNYALNWIKSQMNKYQIVYVNKEKWGINDVSTVQFWDGSLSWLISDKIFSTRRLKNTILILLIDYIKDFITYVIDEGFFKSERSSPNPDRIWMGFKNLMIKSGIRYLVVEYQKKKFNQIYQEACLNWPYFIRELIVGDTIGYFYIKPCKYGIIDGETVYNETYPM